MRYQYVRPLLKTGDVIAIQNNDWTSWGGLESQLVRLATRSEYSHVGLTWCIANRVFVIESVIPHIRIVPLTLFKTFFLVRMPEALSEAAENAMLSEVGFGEYSKWEAVMGFFKRASTKNAKWQCAEFVNFVLTLSGYPGMLDDTPTGVVRNALNLDSTLVMVTE